MKKNTIKRCVDISGVSRMAARTTNRISGRIARSLAINSPWINILEKNKNMKKYKKTIILRNFDTCESEVILFDKPMKIGCHSIRFRDLIPLSVRGTYKITVQFKPSTRKGKY